MPLPLVDITRRGGTDLIGENTWRGVDTLSAHLNLLLTSVEVPIGWELPSSNGFRWPSVASMVAACPVTLPPHGWHCAPCDRRVATVGYQRSATSSRHQGAMTGRSRYSVALSLPAGSVATADRLLMPAGLQAPDGTHHSLAPDGRQRAARAQPSVFQPAAAAHGRAPRIPQPLQSILACETGRRVRRRANPDSRAARTGIDPFAVAP